ncbi:hypothetical protein [Pseudoalteromonas rubra]|nr:hypothetical protein [Pseudoalteromonas rubra]
MKINLKKKTIKSLSYPEQSLDKDQTKKIGGAASGMSWCTLICTIP